MAAWPGSCLRCRDATAGTAHGHGRSASSLRMSNPSHHSCPMARSGPPASRRSSATGEGLKPWPCEAVGCSGVAGAPMWPSSSGVPGEAVGVPGEGCTRGSGGGAAPSWALPPPPGGELITKPSARGSGIWSSKSSASEGSDAPCSGSDLGGVTTRDRVRTSLAPREEPASGSAAACPGGCGCAPLSCFSAHLFGPPVVLLSISLRRLVPSLSTRISLLSTLALLKSNSARRGCSPCRKVLCSRVCGLNSPTLRPSCLLPRRYTWLSTSTLS
mmetsp:Transcript_12457/g.43237  ORF Transcript_12457/g.43237 Transcript_12457/m.43237 type:complete len:272 (-) Transcript_12457:586-1401(-)